MRTLRTLRAACCAMGLAFSSLTFAQDTGPTTEAFANANAIEDGLLSPDGRWLTGAVRTATRRGLLAKELATGRLRWLHVFDQPNLDVELLRWVGSQGVLARASSYSHARGSNRIPGSRLVYLPVEGGKPRSLEPEWDAETNHASGLAQAACPSGAVVHLVDGTTVSRWDPEGARLLPQVYTEDSKPRSWFADAQHRVRLVVQTEDDGAQRVLWRALPAEGSSKLASWQVLRSSPAGSGVQVLGFDADPQWILLIEHDAPSDKTWLVRQSLETNGPVERLVALPEGSQPDGLLRNESDCRAVGLQTGDQLLGWGPDRVDALQGGIEKALVGLSVRVLQWQGDRYLAQVGGARRPPELLVGVRSRGTLDAVSAGYPSVPVDLPLRVQTLPSGSRLWLPAGARLRLPLAVCLGTCELADGDQRAGFVPLAAWLTQRGYAVLMPERTGGWSAWMRWGDDWAGRAAHAAKLLDGAVAEAVTLQPALDADRVAVLGLARYEATLALQWALQREAPLQGVIGMEGIGNPREHLRELDREELTDATRSFTRRMVGAVRDARLDRHAPDLQPQRLRAPLLLMSGARFGLLQEDPSERLALAARKVGLKVQHEHFAGSGSELQHPPYRLRAMQAIETFLAEVLRAR